MQKIVKRKIGDTTHQFMIDGKNLFECLSEERRLLGFYDVPECGICHKSNLYIMAYTTEQGYKYVKIVCSECKASLTFGTRTDDPDVYYLRKTEDKKLAWKKYVPKDNPVENAKKAIDGEEVPPPNDEDSLPF